MSRSVWRSRVGADSASRRRLLAWWPRTAYTQNSSAAFQRAPLAKELWQVTMKHKGHRHMDSVHHAMLGSKDKMNFLRNFGWNRSSGVVVCFPVSKRESKSDVCNCDSGNNFTAMLASNFTVCTLKWPVCYGPSHTGRLLFFSYLAKKRKSILVSALHHLSLFPSKVSFHELGFLVTAHFQFPFRQTRKKLDQVYFYHYFFKVEKNNLDD